MKPHIAFAALMLSLTPVLAQNAPEPQPGQSAPPSVAAQPSEQQPPDESTPVQQSPAPADVQQAPEAAPPAEAQTQESQPSSDSDRRPRRSLQVTPAVRPRADAASYPVSRNLQQFSIGARLLSPKEIEQKFSTPLGKHYLVVEVAVYPSDSQTVKLRTESFTLRAGNDDQAFFPALPEDIARGLSKSGSGPRNIAAYPTVGVGYENGPWGRGVSTGVGVGVGGSPYPRRGGMGNGNTRVMERELQDKAFPEGNLTEPVAGYLYFPLPDKRAPHYNLELTRKGEVVSLALPEPKK